ncbi:hypothetical protein QKU48_gp0535 [Fadolivirus algeromassiliense]|jgi:hypothetical protein|uniref:Uncharacterized protein n=1 Tax=Fadolivirus FV1/VV64 TaxID=3070911 RepID=A0A7D3UQQ3_9VIRU|nr:hypothetical protein QKU48_gp0535 [Fadolivirus algeromassiliense]QKF93993.1 hypothetical protein Fadolivirus_1_535 [Fadolivirus FV1/VV64]
MNYTHAKNVVILNYPLNATKLIESLSQEAIITLAGLCNQNVKRIINDNTIIRLSTMEPYKQCGYLSNPFLQWAIDLSIQNVISPPKPIEQELKKVHVPSKITKQKKKPKHNESIQAMKKEPEEVENDNSVLFDLFD